MDPVDAFKAQMKQTEKLKKVKLLTPSEITTFVASIQKSNPTELGNKLNNFTNDLVQTMQT
jgi:hypothetical protein